MKSFDRNLHFFRNFLLKNEENADILVTTIYQGYIMLLQFQCKNHRSIKDEITFSMLTSSDDSHEKKLIKNLGEGNYISRCASLYGANGSGKTSIISAILYMKQFVVGSNSYQNESQIARLPHKLTVDSPTKYSINFEKNGIVYHYSFEYDDKEILAESLYYWPNGKKAMVFERTSKIVNNEPTFKFSTEFRKIGENCRGRLKSFKLLLSVAFSETNIEYIADVFNFFQNDLVILFSNEPSNWLQYSIDMLKKDVELRKIFLDFLHSIGSDILDLALDTQIRTFSEKELLNFPPEVRPAFTNQKLRLDILNLKYKDFDININDESEGIKKLFAMVCPLIDIIRNNKLFFCDEIENSLHSSIVLEIIRRFFNNEKSTAQLIFATHNTEILDLNIMRRDQIWFTELEKTERKTDLYSLSDIKNVRKDEAVQKGYIAGKYGAIPMINTEIQKICEEC